jgi:flagellar biosynthetic protein FliQ
MYEYFTAIAKQTLYLALIITAPPVAVALIIGLVISIIQATTQIQEMTITFVPKLIGVVVTLAVGGEWMYGKLLSFATHLLSNFYKSIG